MEQSLTCNGDYLRILLLSVPLIFGGVIHMFAVKKNILSYFNKPIHQRWFGQNKTWRGFFIMPLATFPGVIVSRQLEMIFDINGQVFTQHSPVLIAVLLGLGYCLAELPNSYVKRRLGVKEGQTSKNYKWMFIIIDQADSAFGCLFAYKLIAPISWMLFWKTVAFGTCLHLLINILLFKAKMRKSPY